MAHHRTGVLGIFVIWLVLSQHVFRTLTAPQTSLCEIQKNLKEKGLKEITSTDEFTKSVNCVACGVTLRVESDKIVWMLARHSQLATHKNKAGWYLDDGKNVVEYKPKGKNNNFIENISGCFFLRKMHPMFHIDLTPDEVYSGNKDNEEQIRPKLST